MKIRTVSRYFAGGLVLAAMTMPATAQADKLQTTALSPPEKMAIHRALASMSTSERKTFKGMTVAEKRVLARVSMAARRMAGPPMARPMGMPGAPGGCH